jgi:predicted anti-sigma-YlaC factor YlaD
MMPTTVDPFDPETWSATSGCEAFELALELRSHAALATPSIVVLEAHLGACEACREFAARLAGVDAALAAHSGELTAPNWHSIREQLHASVQRYRWRSLWAIGVAATIPIIHVLFSPGTYWRISSVSGLALSAAIMGVVFAAETRRRHHLLGQTDVVATYRHELERRLRIARTAVWLWPIFIVGEFVRACHSFMHIRTGATFAHARLATSVALMSCALAALLYSIVTARGARRELAALR